MRRPQRPASGSPACPVPEAPARRHARPPSSAGTLTLNPVPQDLGDDSEPQEAPCAPAGGSTGHPSGARQGVPATGGGGGGSEGGAPPRAPCGAGAADPPTACALGLSLRLDSETQPGFGLDSAPADEARAPQRCSPAPSFLTIALGLVAIPYALLYHGRQQ